MFNAEIMVDNKPIVTPFLKWAGGKRWLVSSHPELFPEDYACYLEPFLGSGAVFFHLQPDEAVLGDVNADLINTYDAIKCDWKAVYTHLKTHQRNHNKAYYYEIRGKAFRSPIKKAAQFIYLNRTCFNGIYRVNLDGKFNVPMGTKNNVLLSTDDFKTVSETLHNADFYNVDFEKIIDISEKNDFLFIDPPYTVKHNNNGFIQYNENIFSWDDQVRLRDCIDNAVIRGVKVLLTNADHSSIRELYKDIGTIKSLDRLSVISGKANARGRYSELIVKSF